MQPVSLYIHIPFCKHRCGYCDFTTYAGMESLIPEYIEAITKEIEGIGKSAPEPLAVHTIYFGGGTPSLVSPLFISRIIQSIQKNYYFQSDVEISMEANPGTVTKTTLAGYRNAGVNRLSFGMQSAIPNELQLLQRIHTFQDVSNAVTWAREGGFENLSLDLIFAIPGQSLQHWQESLDLALALQVDHVSLYNLTIEEGTPLFQQVQTGAVAIPDEDLAAEMYENAISILKKRGFLHYEISSWACNTDGNWMTCHHNLQIWRNLPYLGFGVGAHGSFNHQRMANTSMIPDYIQRIRKGIPAFPASAAVQDIQMIPTFTEMQETMMVGLRLLDEGVSCNEFRSRFGVSIESVFGKELEELTKLGLIEINESIRLTSRGLMVGNQVFLRFV